MKMFFVVFLLLVGWSYDVHAQTQCLRACEGALVQDVRTHFVQDVKASDVGSIARKFCEEYSSRRSGSHQNGMNLEVPGYANFNLDLEGRSARAVYEKVCKEDESEWAVDGASYLSQVIVSSENLRVQHDSYRACLSRCGNVLDLEVDESVSANIVRLMLTWNKTTSVSDPVYTALIVDGAATCRSPTLTVGNTVAIGRHPIICERTGESYESFSVIVATSVDNLAATVGQPYSFGTVEYHVGSDQMFEISTSVFEARSITLMPGARIVIRDDLDAIGQSGMVEIRVGELTLVEGGEVSRVMFASEDFHALDGALGAPGRNGQSNGAHGSRGESGESGSTRNRPRLKFIVESIRVEGSADGDEFRSLSSVFEIDGRGLRGGDGGNGGVGGDGIAGSKGQQGRHRCGTFNCRCVRQNGRGQAGGNAGGGGVGGNAGNGGDGAIIEIIASHIGDARRLAEVTNVAAGPAGSFGLGGAAGNPGPGGPGGTGGGGHCGSQDSNARRGARGAVGARGANGAEGVDGRPGRVMVGGY